MAFVKLVIKSFKEKHLEPPGEECVLFVFGMIIAAPERPQEVFIATRPSFALDEIQEHAAIEKLQSVVMRPGRVASLLQKVFLKNRPCWRKGTRVEEG